MPDGALPALQHERQTNAIDRRTNPQALATERQIEINGLDLQKMTATVEALKATTTVLHAAARGIEIESLTTRLVGNIDLQGLLALADVPAGYRPIRIEMDIKARNASDDDLDELLRFAQVHSPVCNTICRPVSVVLERVTP